MNIVAREREGGEYTLQIMDWPHSLSPNLFFMYGYSTMEIEDLKGQWVVNYIISKFKMLKLKEKKKRNIRLEFLIVRIINN